MQRKIVFILTVAIVSFNMLITTGAVLSKDNIRREIRNTATVSDAEWATKSNGLKRNTNTTEVQEKNTVCKVSFPTNIRACLDPGNLIGKGQVFSDIYEIENYGNSDVAIKIKNIQIIGQTEEVISEYFGESMASHSDAKASHSNAKKLDIKMVWKNEAERMEKVLLIEDGAVDKYVLFLKASKYNKDNEYISLNESSKGLFYFTGTLDTNQEFDWKNSGLTIRFDYEIEIEENDEE